MSDAKRSGYSDYSWDPAELTVPGDGDQCLAPVGASRGVTSYVFSAA